MIVLIGLLKSANRVSGMSKEVDPKIFDSFFIVGLKYEKGTF
jgi:hypothetical protein